jgi:hypothetical protein
VVNKTYLASKACCLEWDAAGDSKRVVIVVDAVEQLLTLPWTTRNTAIMSYLQSRCDVISAVNFTVTEVRDQVRERVAPVSARSLTTSYLRGAAGYIAQGVRRAKLKAHRLKAMAMEPHTNSGGAVADAALGPEAPPESVSGQEMAAGEENVGVVRVVVVIDDPLRAEGAIEPNRYIEPIRMLQSVRAAFISGGASSASRSCATALVLTAKHGVAYTRWGAQLHKSPANFAGGVRCSLSCMCLLNLGLCLIYFYLCVMFGSFRE